LDNDLNTLIKTQAAQTAGDVNSEVGKFGKEKTSRVGEQTK
jgi:hypothetical protein